MYGFDMEAIAHTKAIYYPYVGHSLCHTISILGPYMAHITRFGKGNSFSESKVCAGTKKSSAILSFNNSAWRRAVQHSETAQNIAF